MALTYMGQIKRWLNAARTPAKPTQTTSTEKKKEEKEYRSGALCDLYDSSKEYSSMTKNKENVSQLDVEKAII